MRKVLLSRISFSALMLTFLTFIFLFSFSSSLEVSQWDKGNPSGNITNEYINNTYINQTLELNSTQFETGEPATIKTSWLTSFIESISKWANYYTITEIDNRYSNNTGDQNLSTYVQGNMSSETTTTYTPTNGSALNFDGVDDYVDISDDYELFSYSISLWFYEVAGGGAGTGYKAVLGGDYGNNNLKTLDIHVAESSHKIQIINREDGSAYFITAPDEIDSNRWYHVVFTRNYTNRSIWVDGNLVINNTYEALDKATVFNYLNIGRSLKDIGQNRWWKGSIDEVLIFNRSLNSTEISQLYNSGRGLYANTSVAPFNSGLVSGWHFDEGSGTTAIDVTGRNNGTLVNGPSWVDGKVPHNIATQVLGAIGLMPWVSATNFISTDFSLQWIGNTLKNPWKTISTLGNSTNKWNVHLNNVTMNGTQGWSGNCVNSSILNGIIVGCND